MNGDTKPGIGRGRFGLLFGVAASLLLMLPTGEIAAQEPRTPESRAPAAESGGDPANLFLRNQVDVDRKIREFRRQALRNISQGRPRLAIENLKQLVSLDPYEADYHVSLGVLFAKVQNFEEARRKFQDFMDLGGNLAVAHLLIAETYATINDRDKAFGHLRKAAENGLNLMKAAKESPALASYVEDTDFIKLSLQLEQYQLDLVDQGDPMTAVFAKVDRQDEVVEAPQINRWSKEKQEEVLTAAKNCLLQIEIYLSRADENKAMEYYEKLLDYTQYSDRITVPRLNKEFRAILAQKEHIESRIKEIRLKYFYKQALEIVDRMKRDFRNQDYPQIEVLYTDLQKVGDRMLEIDPDFREVSDRVMTVGQVWLERSQVRREFESKTLDIQGIVVHEGPPLAIMNDKILRVGEPYDDMWVLAIEPNQILFNYKGEKIPLVFRRY